MSTVVFGVGFGIITAICFGLANGIAQPLIKQFGSVVGVFWRNLPMSFFLFAVLFFVDHPPINLFYIVWTIILSIILYIPLLSFFKAIEIGKIGIVTPVTNGFA